MKLIAKFAEIFFRREALLFCDMTFHLEMRSFLHNRAIFAHFEEYQTRVCVHEHQEVQEFVKIDGSGANYNNPYPQIDAQNKGILYRLIPRLVYSVE